MWFLICDSNEEYITYGNSPKEAFEIFMEIFGECHYIGPRYFKAEEKKIRVELVVEED